MTRNAADTRADDLSNDIIDTQWTVADRSGTDESVARYVRRDAPTYRMDDGEYLCELLLRDDRLEVVIWHYPQRGYWVTELERPVAIEEVVQTMDDMWDEHAEPYDVAVDSSE